MVDGENKPAIISVTVLHFHPATRHSGEWRSQTQIFGKSCAENG